MTTKNQRVKHEGERKLILGWMADIGLIYDPARPEDLRETVRSRLECFGNFATWLLEKRLVYPEGVPAGVDVEDWNVITMIPDMALDICKASRAIGFTEGVQRFHRALRRISAYYSKYPERLLIAKYIRTRHDAMSKEICDYVDTQEDLRISSLPPALMHARPYPLPWESVPLKDRAVSTTQCLEQRIRWADALDKKKNRDLRKVKYLRSFLSKEKAIALHHEDAQLYFAWLQWSAGQVIECEDGEHGGRAISFGDSWLPIEHFGAELPAVLSKFLPTRVASAKVRASGPVH
jgi:hypothetical protein